jgi:glycosyltransferase involved in cell wall biosynthesis
MALSSTSGILSDARHARSSALRRALLARAAFLVAQTDQGARELDGLVSRARIAIVPNPVVQGPVLPLTGAHVALFSGRFAHEKDLPRLVEAWAEVVKEIPDARLLLAGAGGDYRSVERELRRQVAADSVLREAVTFMGWVSDLRPLFARADVYVFPSLSEGMSNALLEACAAGRVIVASDIVPNRAVLGDDYPLLFPAGNRDALREALRAALVDGNVRIRAVDQVRERMSDFAPDRVVAQLEDLLAMALRSS